MTIEQRQGLSAFYRRLGSNDWDAHKIPARVYGLDKHFTINMSTETKSIWADKGTWTFYATAYDYVYT